MLNANEPIKVVYLQTLANQPICNNALVISTIIFISKGKEN